MGKKKKKRKKDDCNLIFLLKSALGVNENTEEKS